MRGLERIRFELKNTKGDLYEALHALNNNHVVELVRTLDQAIERVDRLLTELDSQSKQEAV